MIPRYSRLEMELIWEPQNRFQIWLEIETLVTEALESLKIIPEGISKVVRSKGKFDIERIEEIEKETHHDVVAFLTNVAEYVGPEARFIHQGLTSSDILDTCLSVQLKQATEILLNDLTALMASLKERAFEYKDSICIGRSHGIHAEPTTFGLKLAGFYEEFSRAHNRLNSALKEISTCKISGAVGTFANIDPRVEKYVAEKLGLEIEPISTQIIPRDRHAYYFATLGVIASSIERLALEIRHLQRSEVGEAEEYFSKGQKGSSAMPHKRNPVISENLTGLSRLVRSSVIPALEDVALWHERDISHSSVERIIAPDTTITLDFALNRANKLIERLVIYPEKMKKNLDQFQGLHNSQRILLSLTRAGVSREDAYKIVQTSAMTSWKDQRSFQEVLQKSDVSKYLPENEVKSCFDDSYHLKYVDTIFQRIFED